MVDEMGQKIIKGEYFLSTLLVDHSLPLNTSDHAASLFKKSFPDSVIAKNNYAQEQKQPNCERNCKVLH